MTDEAKKIVEELRESACKGCIHDKIGRCMHIQQGKFCGSERHKAADLIEKLSAQLVNQAIEYSQALKITTEQRDAAIADLKDALDRGDAASFCEFCKHNDDWGKCEHPCNPYSGETGWEWRGVPKEET